MTLVPTSLCAGGDVSQHGEENQEQPSPVTINVEQLPADTRVVQVAGDLTGDGAAAMQRVVNDELTRSPAQVIVDLSAVTRIDERGISALSAAARTAGEADLSFCLVHADANPLGAALSAARLRELFEIFPSVDDAVRGHRPPSEK
jgi:anti-anti-sigma factor